MSRHRALSRAGPGALAGAHFLDPDVLARIDNLELLARTVVDGFLNGLHRSPYLGLSLDFAEHRPYMPGDDIRRIDWRLYARTDRHYIKLFEAETNADLVVLLDVSRSMGYGSGAVTKLDYGRYLGACLAYFSRQQRDRVGLITFDRDVVDYVPPSGRHLDLVLHALDRAAPMGAAPTPTRRGRDAADGASGMDTPLRKAAERLRRKGILVLISDFYDDVEEVVRSVRLLGGRGHDVLVFHVLDPAELTFPFEEPGSFADMETGETIPVVPQRLRDGYADLLEQHLDELRRRLAGTRIDYTLLDSSKPLDHALHRFLIARERRSRVR